MFFYANELFIRESKHAAYVRESTAAEVEPHPMLTVEGEPDIGTSWLVRHAAHQLADCEIVDRVAAASPRPSLFLIDVD